LIEKFDVKKENFPRFYKSLEDNLGIDKNEMKIKIEGNFRYLFCGFIYDPLNFTVMLFKRRALKASLWEMDFQFPQDFPNPKFSVWIKIN
jgi:hypothetical protein